MFRNSQICQHCIFINWFNIFFFHSNFIDDLHWLRESRNHQYHHCHQIILDLAALYKIQSILVYVVI